MSNRDPSEEPIKGFTGWFIPAHVVALTEDGTLNIKEAVLLAIIDSFARGPRGCFASNKYLGQKLQVGADRIKQMVSKLVKLGLVFQSDFDGRSRKLDVYWSSPDVTGQTGKKFPSRPGKNSPHINKGDGTGAAEGPGAPNPQISSPEKEGKSAPSAQHRAWAKNLEETIGRVVTINRTSKTSTWPEQFRLLEQYDKRKPEEIEAALSWYREHVRDKYAPVCESARAFRDKFHKILFAMSREESGGGESGESKKDKFPKGETKELAMDVRKLYDDTDGKIQVGYPSDEFINRWLKGKGLRPGRISRVDVVALDVGYAEAFRYIS